MIPKDSTPVKHKILTEIFAKRLLTLDEIAIVSYIMRWSWGFDNGERRQDWTNKLTKRKIANDIGMYESHLNRTINKMILGNKIMVKDKCYQFNEHYEEWKNLPKKQVLKNGKKLTKLVSKTYQKGKENLPKKQVKLTKKSSLGMPNNQGKGIKNKDVRGGEHTSKDTTKDNIKETLKDKGTIFIKAWEDFKAMRKKIRKGMTKRAEELLLNELDKLTNSEEEQVAILEQSIMNSWLGVFPLKGDYNGKNRQNNQRSGTKRSGEDKYKHLEETYKV